nr:MAG TPA: hypothetical protein [Caudoviricetes sp.]
MGRHFSRECITLAAARGLALSVERYHQRHKFNNNSKFTALW